MQFQFAYAVSTAAANAKADAASNRNDGGASVGESVAAAKEANDATLVGSGKNGGRSGPKLGLGVTASKARYARTGEGTGDWASDFKAILKKIKNIQPDVSMYGGMNRTGGLLAKQAPLGNRAANLGGDGVRAGKVAELAPRAQGRRTSSKAGLPPTPGTIDAGFALQDQGQYEDRFCTPAQVVAHPAYEVMHADADTLQRAVSIDAPKVLEAKPSDRFRNGSVGAVAFDDKGDLKEGAITVHDFKDSGIAVLEAVGM
ncbi:hypothetical protein FAZ95_04470 [Trinickia violacea]|uniref:Uncharacterized protein n=1 Tax=Trinickia violacea TaxID=2571746 RepID=A0A4P8IKY1_9BURK|nr:hypothetical protein [Trinickia violacea]QCP48511.1 hypothetical protein FAZ95_04470 [Trinickia violacea]